MDDALLHHNLIEIREHVVYARQIRHLHLEAEGFGNVYDRDVYLIRSAQEWALVLLISRPELAKHGLLRPLVRFSLRFLLALTLSATVFRVSTTALAGLANSHAWIYSHNLVIDVLFGTDQPLLDALYDFLALHLILQVLLEDQLAVAFAVEREVSRSFHVVLIDHTKLSGNAVALINVQYAGWLSEGRRLAGLGYAHKWRGLARVLHRIIPA